MNEARGKSGPGSVVLWGSLILVIVLIAVMTVALKTRKQSVGETPPEKRIAVRVVVLRSDDIPDTIVLPGRMEPFAKADVAVEKPGKIVSIAVDKGDDVDAGAILMRIDNALWKVIQRQMEIELADAEKKFARWQALRDAGDVSGSEFDSVTMRRDLARAAADEARIHVEQCDIRSPISGRVDARHVELGEYANEGQQVFKVVNTDRLKVALNVPEQDIVSVVAGSAIPFTVAALPDSVFTGRVSFVSVEGSRESNSFETELAVDDPAPSLRPGMIANVALSRGVRKGCIAVPLTSVIPKRGESVVYVVSGDRAVKRVVKTESIIGHVAILSSGVAAGDRLVVEGHRALQDGMAVEIKGEAENKKTKTEI